MLEVSVLSGGRSGDSSNPGQKSEAEKFPGALSTYTVERMGW